MIHIYNKRMEKYMKLKTVIMKKSAQRRANYRTDPTFIFTLKPTGKKSTTLIVDLFSKKEIENLINIFKSLTLLSRNSSWAVTQAEILWSPAVSSSLTKIDHENM